MKVYAEIAPPRHLLTQRFPGCIIRRLFTCTFVPHKYGNSMGFQSSPIHDMVGLQPSFPLSTGCVVALRGDWAIFCHAGSGRVGRVRSLEIFRCGWELNLGHREGRQWAIHWAIMTRATGTTDSELFHWAIMTQATWRTDSELSHWAIMVRATWRTDSELSHWAIMVRATWRTDNELSNWAIMVRPTWRTDSELFHWAIKTRCAIHSVIASPYHGKCGMTYTLLECRGKCIENEEMLIGVDLRNLVDCMRARDPLGHWYTYNIQRSIYITLCWDNITLW